MSRIFWDTHLFVYLIEDAGARGDQVVRLRKRMLERGDHLFTSAPTLRELLAKPVEAGRDDLRRRYEDALSSGATILAFDRDAAVRCAAMRSDHTMALSDAIQLATAAAAGMDLFITNDDRLGTAVVPGIHFITSLARAFL
jgi:predicted nucleic acid-binding protein